MLFSSVLGQHRIKAHLTQGVDKGRIPHAQLFVGPEGSGTLPMAIAYAQYILCNNTGGENTPRNGDANSCNLKFNSLTHPDLHFVFPLAANATVKSHPVSRFFLNEWRQLLKEQPYGNLFDWYKLLGIDNKQGQIGVDESQEIIKSLSLKSYEGGYKIMLIWMAEKMNVSCANKLLKLIEEPPNNTLFILIVENEEQLINTIKSRCQILHFPPIAEKEIQEGLVKNYQLENSIAAKIAHHANGNYNKACDLVYRDSEDYQFEKWFVYWVRSAFKAKGNKSAILDLLQWSNEIAKVGRETQKQFLHFCLEFFRQALMLNYSASELVFMSPKSDHFKLENFAPFIQDNNIIEINSLLQNAIYHIERNGNSKIILTDLSIQLTRLIHKKAG